MRSSSTSTSIISFSPSRCPVTGFVYCCVIKLGIYSHEVKLLIHTLLAPGGITRLLRIVFSSARPFAAVLRQIGLSLTERVYQGQQQRLNTIPYVVIALLHLCSQQ